MRTRPANVLRDVTPGNTPRPKRATTAKATVKATREQLLGTTTRLPALKLKARDDDDDELPRIPALPIPPSPSGLPTGTSLPLESTPLGHRTRVIHTVKKAPAAPHPRQAFSPLPPSSPPSMSSYDEDAENRPPPQEEVEQEDNDMENEYDNDDNDEQNLAAPEAPVHAQAHHQAHDTQARQPSSDDPFGFTALERRLKLQREIRRRSAGLPAPMPIPKGKGKELARLRAPLGELAAPIASTSAASLERAPTPYHPSDDLEDMYLDPTLPPVHLGSQASHAYSVAASEHAVEADLAPARAPTPSEEEDDDPTRTPHPRHVANIVPLRSAFSSREATPCDRSLPESPLSSPSPVKPLTVPRPLPVLSSTAKKKEKGRVASSRAFPSSTPIPTPLPAGRIAKLAPTSLHRVRPATIARANNVEKEKERRREETMDPIAISRNLEKLLPKRTKRLPAQAATSPTVATTQKRGRGRPRKVPLPLPREESDAESSGAGSSSEGERSLPSSPLAKGKRRAPQFRVGRPAKRMRVEVVITKRPPSARRAAGKSSDKPPARRDKGKGRAHASPRRLPDEDSVRGSSSQD